MHLFYITFGWKLSEWIFILMQLAFSSVKHLFNTVRRSSSRLAFMPWLYFVIIYFLVFYFFVEETLEALALHGKFLVPISESTDHSSCSCNSRIPIKDSLESRIRFIFYVKTSWGTSKKKGGDLYKKKFYFLNSFYYFKKLEIKPEI